MGGGWNPDSIIYIERSMFSALAVSEQVRCESFSAQLRNYLSASCSVQVFCAPRSQCKGSFPTQVPPRVAKRSGSPGSTTNRNSHHQFLLHIDHTNPCGGSQPHRPRQGVPARARAPRIDKGLSGCMWLHIDHGDPRVIFAVQVCSEKCALSSCQLAPASVLMQVCSRKSSRTSVLMRVCASVLVRVCSCKCAPASLRA